MNLLTAFDFLGARWQPTWVLHCFIGVQSARELTNIFIESRMTQFSFRTLSNKLFSERFGLKGGPGCSGMLLNTSLLGYVAILSS